MRVVIQRVSHASVTIDGHCKSAIQKGMMILVGIEETDSRRYRLVMQENRKSPYF